MNFFRANFLALLAVFATTGAVHAACDWCIPGATVEMDFEHNRYYNASSCDLTNSSSTGGWAVAKSGILRQFSPSTLRLTDYGLLIEKALRNSALWSRDLTKSVWVRTNMSAAPAPAGADGTAAGGTRLTALASNAKIVQTVNFIPDVSPDKYAGGLHEEYYIKRVSGTGSVKFIMNGNTAFDASSLLNTNTYTQVSIRLDGKATSIAGIQLGTAGDVIDVDMVEFDAEGTGFVEALSPFPTTDTPLLRSADVVTVNPGSNLYQTLLTATAGTLYAKSFNCLSDSPRFLSWASKSGDGRKFGANGGGAPRGANVPFLGTRTTSVQTTLDSRKHANYAWTTIGDAYVVQPFSMTHTGSTVRTVATWGGGQISIVANNGPVVTKAATAVTDNFAVPNGNLYVGFDIRSLNVSILPWACDGYIQDIAFIPGVAAGYGASLTVGPDGPPGPN